VDGCALFWKRNRFRLVENYAIEFNECARRAASAMGLGLNTEDGNQYMHRLSKVRRPCNAALAGVTRCVCWWLL
jgi:CCR4-NOT transcription complex subunit 6